MRAPRLAVILAVSVRPSLRRSPGSAFFKAGLRSLRGQADANRGVRQREARRAPAAQSTPISDAELNAYFEYGAKGQIPPGIVEPRLNALGDGRVGGQAVVDLDAVRKQKQRGWLDPMAYLTGSLPLTASGLLITKDGVGRFQLESAQISGVSVPKSLLQELLGVLLAHAGEPARHQHGRSVRAACAHPRDPASSGGKPPSCSEVGCMLSAAWTISRPLFST